MGFIKNRRDKGLTTWAQTVATITTPSGLVEGDSYHLFILSPWANTHQHSS